MSHINKTKKTLKNNKNTETLIGILLYIGAITTNTTYTTSDITNIESENHSIVLSIENDPEQLDNAINIFLQEGDKVIVLEEIYY